MDREGSDMDALEGESCNVSADAALDDTTRGAAEEDDVTDDTETDLLTKFLDEGGECD